MALTYHDPSGAAHPNGSIAALIQPIKRGTISYWNAGSGHGTLSFSATDNKPRLALLLLEEELEREVPDDVVIVTVVEAHRP